MDRQSSKTPCTPIVSRVLSDGRLVEMLYRPDDRTTWLAIGTGGGAVSVESSIELPDGERLVPYSPTNNLIASGCVLLPSHIGEFVDEDGLLRDIRSYLHRFVDLSPMFEEIAAHYALLSWTYDVFNDLPYLRFRGDYGTGKTRALLAVGSICYKPFFASGASTVSPIFHILDAFGGTLILDEADFRFSDATADLSKILNNGNMSGLPVLRTMTNRHRELNPRAFKVFGPKILAQRGSFADDALESRFLTEETSGRTLRSDIPLHLPVELGEEARELRNRLLAWRFHRRHAIELDASLRIERVEPRLNQVALPLLSIIRDPELRERIGQHLRDQEGRVRCERSLSVEAVLLAALLKEFSASESTGAQVGRVADRFNCTAAEEFGQPMSVKWVGRQLRTTLHLSTVKSHGVYVVPASERSRVETLARRFNVMPACGPERVGSDFPNVEGH